MSSSKIYVTPNQFGYHWEPLEIPLSATSALKGWKIKGQNAETLIVQFHGNSENRSSHFFSLAWLTSHKMDLVTFDYCGFGDSSSSYSKSCDDQINIVLDYVKQVSSNYKKVILYGQSLGGYYLLKNLPDSPLKFDLLVLDGTFDSRWKLLKAKLGFTSFNKKMINISTKTLIIHGAHDPVTPYPLGKNLQEIIPDNDFLTIPEGHHLDTFVSHELIYRKKFFDYLNYPYQTPPIPNPTTITLSEILALKEMFPEISCANHRLPVIQYPVLCASSCSCDWLARHFKQLGSKKLAQMMYRQKDKNYDQRKDYCKNLLVNYCGQ